MKTSGKIFNYRPMLSICLFLMAGIIFVVNIYIGKIFNIILAVLSVLCLIVTIVVKWVKAKDFKLFKLLSVFLSFIIGVGLSVGFIEVYNKRDAFNGEYLLTASVCEQTSLTDKGRFVVTVDDVFATNLETLKKTKIKGKVRLYLDEVDERTRSFQLGEVVSANVELLNVNLFEDGRNNFSLYNRGVYVLGFGTESDIIGTNNIEASISEKFKTKVKSVLEIYMSKDYSSLAYTMLFGEKGGLSEELKDGYSASGIGHLLAVSGLHVGFIVTLLAFILNLFKANKKVKFFLITGVIFIYAFLCGFSVSVTRAFIMTAVLLYSKMRMFKYDGLSSLSLAAVILLIINPLWLFDAGFQLSFLAVSGIIVLSPVLSRFFSKYFHDKFASAVSVCIAAQVGTIPVMLTVFSNLSIFSVITNLVCIPIASIAYMLLFGFTLLSLLIPPLGVFTYMFEFLMSIITGISSLTGALSLVGVESWILVCFSIFLVITCVVVSDYVFLKTNRKKGVCCVMSLLTLVSFVLIFIL